MSSTPVYGYALGIFIASLLGALPPLLGRWSSRQLHLFVAFGAGIFLGAVFLHILPELAFEGIGNAVNALVLAGFIGVLLIEKVLLAQHELHCDEGCSHSHVVLGWTTLIGLSAHSFAEGLALGLGVVNPKLGFVVFIAIIAHKSVASFSLATVFRLAGFSAGRSMKLVLIFSLMTPLATLFAVSGLNALPHTSATYASAIAGGTFLYVATCDLLPEAFHDSSNRVQSFLALLAGIAIMVMITH